METVQKLLQLSSCNRKNKLYFFFLHKLQVIAAEGEQNASRAFKEAADVISSSPAALQLRYMQTLSQIASEKNSTIVFPLPIEFMKGFMNMTQGSSDPGMVKAPSVSKL